MSEMLLQTLWKTSQVRMQMYINYSKTQKRNMQKARKRNSDE